MQPKTVLTVDRFADDAQPGSLRHAIETANADPGTYRIEISPPPDGSQGIVLNAPLPPITGPLEIIGTAWAQNGRYTAVDGSGYLERDLKSCPGVVEGQYGTNIRTTSNPGFLLRDTQGVSISGLDIRNFCIGVLCPAQRELGHCRQPHQPQHRRRRHHDHRR